MDVTTGTMLGSYEILSVLGKGGMGEVWRARDTKLGREVAIKTLPHGFSSDADRLSRFEREARVLASLNHPNIASIYGLEESQGMRFLVMELVEGETLAELLKRGPLSVEDALKLAVMPNGKEFVMVYLMGTQAQTAAPMRPRIEIVLNWFEELRSRVTAH